MSALYQLVNLTKLAQKQHWNMGKKKILVTLTSFLESHRHFEYQILTKKSVSARCLLIMDSGQTLCIVLLG